MIQYIYDTHGYLTSTYDGTGTIISGATALPPVYTEGFTPQFKDGAWLDQSITVSPVEFKLLWTSAERIAIKGFKNSDPIIEDFYEMLDDPRLNFVNLSLESTRQAVEYLLSKLHVSGVVTDTELRKAEILSGAFR